MGKDIVKWRYLILVFFVAIIALACALLPKMISKVNYDLTSYLPSGYNTHDGYEFVSETFNIHGDIEIGVEATRAEAEQAAEDIAEIGGVTNVVWADTLSFLLSTGVYDQNNAEDMARFDDLRAILTDAPRVDDDAKHNWALLVTLKYPPSSQEAIKAFGQIEDKLRQTLGDAYSMSGMTEQANALFETVFDELWLYCLIAGIVVLIILALTTNSLMEPIILLLTMLISIIINLGTNAVFPSTSIITFACSAILQLGLSMDYAIFLLHQYRQELKTTLDSKQALAAAIPKSAKAVAASALTTICGFLALLFMKFGVGPDLGLTLAKGILCSLLTVLLLQPCLMLMMDKARIKTQHRCLDFKFKHAVKRTIKDRGWVALVFVLLLVPMYFASASLDFAYLKFLPDSGDTSAKHAMAQQLGNQVMIVLPNEYKDAEGTTHYLVNENYEFIERIEKMKDEGKVSFSLGLYAMIPEGSKVFDMTLEDVFKFVDLVGDGEIPGELGEGLNIFRSYVSGGYTMYTVGINPAIGNESKESFAILDELQAVAEEIFGSYGRCYFTGVTQAAYDFAAVTPDDFMWVTVVSILAILIILILTLGSVKFPLVLVALIEFGIWLNIAMQYVFSGGAINFMSYLVITAVQLGATVDYAILLTTKYRGLRKRFEPRQAAYVATTSSTMTILTSALIMAGACFSVFFVSSNLVVKEMTFLMARGALISAILVIFVLPALLSLVDRPRGDEIHIMRTELRPFKLKKRKRKTIEPLAESGDKA